MALIVLVVSHRAAAGAGQAASPRSPRNTLHVNPIFVGLGYFHLAYGRVLGDHLAIQIESGVIKPWGHDNEVFTVEVRPLFHAVRPAPAGLYVAPFLRFAYEDRQSWDRGDLMLIPGVAIGWSMVWRWIFLRVGGGFMALAHAQRPSGVGSGFMPSVLPYLEAALGVTF